MIFVYTHRTVPCSAIIKAIFSCNTWEKNTETHSQTTYRVRDLKEMPSSNSTPKGSMTYVEEEAEVVQEPEKMEDTKV